MEFFEKGKGKDEINIMSLTNLKEKGKMTAHWQISRWASREDREAGKIYSEEEALRLFKAPQFSEFKYNLLLNIGINELFTIICSSSGTKFDATNAQLGVGDGTAAEDATQTDLQGTNTFWKGMVSGYPTYGTNQQAVWRAQFTETEANFAWNEFAVRNGPAANKLLNRKVSAQGTKTSGQVWELQLTITLS